MLLFILRKTLRALLTMFLVVTFTFLILRISGDPTEVMFPDDVPQEVKDAYRTAWGLDRPLPEQFAKYLVSVGHGDLGYSFRDSRPALDVVTERIPATLRLGLCSFALSVCLGIPLGLCAAFRRNTFLDRLATSVSVMGYSMPNFFLGILLILLFSLKLRLLPSSGSATPEHLIMPVITLGTATAGIVARFTRTAVLDVLGQPFIMAARAKGLSVPRLIRSAQCRHTGHHHSRPPARLRHRRRAGHGNRVRLARHRPSSRPVGQLPRPCRGADHRSHHRGQHDHLQPAGGHGLRLA